MKKLKFSFMGFISHLILLIWCSIAVISIYWMITASFKTNDTIFRDMWSLPEKLSFVNFQIAWSNLQFSRYFFNSGFVVTISVILIIIVSAPAAYALTRMKLRFASPIKLFFIAGMGIPAQLLLIPLFKALRDIHLINTLYGLILVYAAVSIPFTVFLLTGFFLTIPSELEDAAVIDGCNEFQTFFKVMVPIANPGIITAAIFNFIGLWNEYLFVLVLTTGSKQRTLPMGLYALSGALRGSGDYVSLIAGCVTVILPVAIMYMVLSEKLIAGVTLGAIK
ncbi:MAG: carbohydrate ABC transporter permease [Actinomycetia bacterium]|nr:carbohydrate ABC transporter permease [Actinomycetes bacterium]